MMGAASRNAGSTRLTRGEILSLLTSASPDRSKATAEQLAPRLGEVEVVCNRTGLVMLPYRETAHGATFFLGEVLMAEAHIKCPNQNVEGYAMVVGRDLEQAMAIAVLDAVGVAGVADEDLEKFLVEIRGDGARADEDRRRDIEATRVQMETF